MRTTDPADTGATPTAATDAPAPAPVVPVAGGVFARRVVTIAAVLAVAACFGFSFGNVLELGRFLGAPDWVAWLIDPAVAATVAGLVVGVRYLALHGIGGASMRPARAMLAAAGLTTLGLNIAAALFARGHGDTDLAHVADQMAASGSIWWRVGAAAYDAIAPLLLLGWAEVGPWFLRHFHTLATAHQTQTRPAQTPVGTEATAPAAATPSGRPTRSAATHQMPPTRARRPGAGSHRPAGAAAVRSRIAAAYAAGRADGQPWTARTLAEAAGCGKTAAATYLRIHTTDPTTSAAQEVHA